MKNKKNQQGGKQNDRKKTILNWYKKMPFIVKNFLFIRRGCDIFF